MCRSTVRRVTQHLVKTFIGVPQIWVRNLVESDLSWSEWCLPFEGRSFLGFLKTTANAIVSQRPALLAQSQPHIAVPLIGTLVSCWFKICDICDDVSVRQSEGKQRVLYQMT
jgi:hypothetical protein